MSVRGAGFPPHTHEVLPWVPSSTRRSELREYTAPIPPMIADTSVVLSPLLAEAARAAQVELVERHGFLCLAVSGQHSRVIPISPPHDGTLRGIREDDPGSLILGYAAADWDRSRLSKLLQNIGLPSDAPRVRLSRLRVTWVKDHLEHGVHLGELARIAGVASWKIFGHVMPFMAPQSEHEVFASMVRR